MVIFSRKFPNLTEISLMTFDYIPETFYDLVCCKDIFERFVQQLSTTKNPTISFKSLKRDNAMEADELMEIINIITKNNVKVKLGLNVDCSSFRGECNYCFREKRFFLSVKQHTTVAFGTIRYRDKLSHSIDILKAFKNLSVLHLKFGLNSVINNFMASYNPKFRGFGLRKLKILKDVKLEYEKDLDDHDSDMLNSFYQFFEFICSMMPRNVEVL